MTVTQQPMWFVSELGDVFLVARGHPGLVPIRRTAEFLPMGFYDFDMKIITTFAEIDADDAPIIAVVRKGQENK